MPGCGCSTPTAPKARCAATASAASPSTSTIMAWSRKQQVAIETGRGILTLDLEIAGGRVQRVQGRHGPADPRAGTDSHALAGQPADRRLDRGRRSCTGRHRGLDGQPARGASTWTTSAAFPLESLGPKLERHPAFPRRVNVHVVEVVGPDEVKMRTWERGSGITLACGTAPARSVSPGCSRSGPNAPSSRISRAATSSCPGPTTSRRSS